MHYPNGFTGLALILIVSLLTIGCQQGSGPSPQTPEDTGKGLIVAECIAGYYQQDQAPYLTQQSHAFNPNAGYLQITASEPTGTYTFTLNKNQFSAAKEPTAFLSGLPASFVNQQLAVAIYYSFAAGAGLLDTTKLLPSDNVKIEGQWYQSLTPSLFGHNTIRLYRNINTERIELVELLPSGSNDPKTGYKWLIRNYNLRYSRELKTLVPMKIDVFDTAKGVASKQLVIQFEYKQILTQ